MFLFFNQQKNGATFGAFLGLPGPRGGRRWTRLVPQYGFPQFSSESELWEAVSWPFFVLRPQITKTMFPKPQKDLLPQDRIVGSNKSWLLGFFSKRIFATNRAAIGRIWTILWGSKAGPRGHILGPFPAPGGPKKSPNKPKIKLEKS